MALAAELALKFACELDHPSKAAPVTHQELLTKQGSTPPAKWCETIFVAFKKCKNTSVKSRDHLFA